MEEKTTALALPSEEQFRHDIAAINQFQRIVHANLIEGQDYGVIPGTSKPTLLKPGAEKIAKLLGLCDHFEEMASIENWEQPFFYYKYKCRLVTLSGDVLTEGVGSCNSKEARYRWRESKRLCPNCQLETIIKGKEEWGGGWLCWQKKGGCGSKFRDGDPAIEGQSVGQVENDDIYSIVNTILKMAKKRAMVDAALSVGRLSGVFTQDMEDISPVTPTDNEVLLREEVRQPAKEGPKVTMRVEGEVEKSTVAERIAQDFPDDTTVKSPTKRTKSEAPAAKASKPTVVYRTEEQRAKIMALGGWDEYDFIGVCIARFDPTCSRNYKSDKQITAETADLWIVELEMAAALKLSNAKFDKETEEIEAEQVMCEEPGEERAEAPDVDSTPPITAGDGDYLPTEVDGPFIPKAGVVYQSKKNTDLPKAKLIKKEKGENDAG